MKASTYNRKFNRAGHQVVGPITGAPSELGEKVKDLVDSLTGYVLHSIKREQTSRGLSEEQWKVTRANLTYQGGQLMVQIFGEREETEEEVREREASQEAKRQGKEVKTAHEQIVAKRQALDAARQKLAKHFDAAKVEVVLKELMED